MASITLGCECPTLIVPIPPAKSINTLLSTSVKIEPSPFTIYTLHTVP